MYRRSMEFPKDRTSSFSERLKCPVCLQPYSDPKVLPCLHSYCFNCLDHLDEVDVEGETCIMCPFCKQTTPSSAVQTSPIVEYVTRPAPTSPGIKKSFQEKFCDPCATEKKFNMAAKFCTGCSEYLCSECDEFHKKFRATKNHAVLAIQDMPEDAMVAASFSKSATCKCPQKRDAEFYCYEHSTLCCSVCVSGEHKNCLSVQPAYKAADDLKSGDTINKLTEKLEKAYSHLKCIRALNETNIRKLQDQVAQIGSTVKFLRKDINHLLDCMENELLTKGKQILSRQQTITGEQVNRCSGYIAAIEFSRSLLKNSVEHGSDSSVVDTVKKVEQHTDIYSKLVLTELSKRRNVGIELILDANLKELSQKSSIGRIQEKELDIELSNTQIITQLKDMTIERTRFVRAVGKGEGKIPRYSGAAYLYNGFVVMVDCNNQRCVLFDPQFKFVSDVKLPSIPWKVTLTSVDEVAVSLPYQNKIQFLCFEDDILKFTRCITTHRPCWGLAAINDRELAVTWDCKGASPGVGIMTTEGEETLFLGKDDMGPEFGPPWQMDFDTGRNRFLISLPTGKVLGVDIDGTICLRYENPKLQNPSGVAVDRDGNVYVCGMKSHNIHQVSSNGECIKVIAMSNLKTPFNICFSKPCDEFLISTVENREELQIFAFK